MSIGRIARVSFSASFLGVLLLGCKPPSGGDAVTPDTTPILSPAETARLLWEAHRKRDYDAVATHIVPSEREAFVRTLRAIDEVILANRILQETAELCYRGPIAETWSLAPMRNNLGLFSQDVTIYNQTLRGDTAEVTIQEGENIPLLHVQFVYHEGRWLLVPEPAPRALAREMQSLASSLWALSDRVKAGTGLEEFAGIFLREVEPRIVRAMTVTDADETAVAGRAETD